MIIQTNEKQLAHNIAVYLRLSKDDGDREESESISNQRAIILEYIKKNFDFENCYEYVDDGFSGATFNRPGFKKMISELKEKNITVVITKNLARLARNYIEAGEYIEKLFPNNNVRYIAILDGVDNFEDRVANEFAPIKGIFNELFCKETSKNIKKSKRNKMTEGLYCCNVAPFGYIKDPDNPGKIIIDKKASEIVKRIFDLKLKGKTSKAIADTFNKEKIITPSEYLKIRGLENRTRRIWTRTMIARILTNEVYIGNCLRGKTQNFSYKSKKRINIRRNEQIITENTHIAIIPEKIFCEVHDLSKYGRALKERKELKLKFGKYLYCGNCKELMRKRKSRNYNNVFCRTKNETDFICSNKKMYIYEDLEENIIKNIKEEFELYFRKNNSNYRRLMKKYNEAEISAIDDKLEEYNKQLGMLKFKISKLYNDRLVGNISEVNYKKIYTDLADKRKEITSIVYTLENKRQKLNNEDESADKIEKVKMILRNFNRDTLSDDDVSELIEKIEIYENYIEIYYKFKKIPAVIECS